MRCVLALLAVTACGDNRRIAGDAHAVDALPVGDVTVTASLRSAADGGMSIDLGVIQPDGTQGPGAVVTLPGEVVLHDVQAGAAVSAIYATGMPVVVTTFLEVQPGDQLVFGDPYQRVDLAGVHMPSVIVSPLAGADHYSVYTAHAAMSVTPGIPTQIDVPNTSTFDLVAIAFDSVSQVIGSAYLPTVPYVGDDQTVTIDTWTPNAIDDVTTSITGVDTFAPQIGLEATAVYGGTIQVGDFSSQYAFDGAASAQLTVPITAPRLIGHVAFSQDVDTYRAAPGTATELELTEPHVPMLDQIFYDFERGRIAWSQYGGQYDAAVVLGIWDAPISVRWVAIVPPGETEVSFRWWPEEAHVFRPSNVANIPEVQLVTAPHTGSIRTLPEWVLTSPETAVDRGELPWAETSHLGSTFVRRAARGSDRATSR